MGGALEAPSQVWEVSMRATSVVDGVGSGLDHHHDCVVGGGHKGLYQTDILIK
jgi:hypothetical protein